MPSIITAENLYMTPRGAGAQNGLSWANAWRGPGGIIWGDGNLQLSPGDTLWVAGGDYGNNQFTISGSGTAANPIYIKRARSTESACTSSQGWKNNMDSTAQWSLSGSTPRGVVASIPNGSYILFDGMVRGGFRFDIDHRQTELTEANFTGALMLFYASLTNFTFRNVIVVGTNYPFGDGLNGWRAATAGNIGAADGYQNYNVTLENVDFIDMSTPLHMGRNDGVIIDHCTFGNIQNFGGNDHSDIVYFHMEYNHGLQGPKNVHVRYCDSWDAQSEGFYVAADNSLGGQFAQNIFFYGNTFRDMAGSGTKCISIEPANGQVDNLQVYNNTFVNCAMPVRLTSANVSNSSAQNNIMYNCNNAPTLPSDYNWYSGSSANNEAHGVAGLTTDPFVNLAGYDFHIATNISSIFPRDKGATLASPFDVDKDGINRRSYAPFDIGAYENNGANSGSGSGRGRGPR
jgi:hypothetical protein